MLAIGLWFSPHAVSLYHQETGGRYIARALEAEGRDEETDPWLEPLPLTRPDARALAEEALNRFRAASAADPGNTRALWWAGRVAMLLDRPAEAVEAYSAAVERDPGNPLLWWELGMAYERLSPARALSEPITPQEVSGLILMDTAGTVPALISPLETRAARSGNPSAVAGSLPIASAEWWLPDAPADRPGWWVPVGPVRRRVAAMAAPAGLTYRVTLPLTPTALIFWMGIDPVVREPKGDGVIYRVEVDGEQVFEHPLTPEAARQGWWSGKVDLTAWAGREVRLTLEVDPGPAGDRRGDWAGWGDVQLVPARAAPCLLASCLERATAAWRAGGFTAQDLINAGEKARRAKQYEEALRWYARAAAIAGERLDTFQEFQPGQLVVLESFATVSAWRPCSWCGNTAGYFAASQGVLEMSYHNTPEKRDGFAFILVPNVPIDDFSELLLRIRGKPETLMTMEVVIDGERSRPLNYQPVPQEWAVWTVPINGEVLNEILIGIGEQGPVPMPDEYCLLIDWIALR